ncbi:hypothetical protein [Pontibacter ummariensis]|uniref:hypothetical protein n=1 Tax=Pontibacter ummariensis TaxID=1610492 RepID=UPI001185BC1E|nr:hypothetical protein [Pontibacter ummariensis]
MWLLFTVLFNVKAQTGTQLEPGSILSDRPSASLTSKFDSLLFSQHRDLTETVQLPALPAVVGHTPTNMLMQGDLVAKANAYKDDTTMYDLGKQNAKLYFHRPAVFNAAAFGSMLGIMTAGVTLALPATLALVPPKIKEKDIPDRAFLQNASYMAGYTAGAKKKKRITVLKGTGVGVLGAAALVGSLYLLFNAVAEPM